MWHRPRDESMPPPAKDTDDFWFSVETFTLLAKTHSSLFSAVVARCRPTNDVEHAVSRVRHGPVRLRRYDIHPEPIARRFPLAEYTDEIYSTLVLPRRGIALDIPPIPTNIPTSLSNGLVIMRLTLSSSMSC